MKWRTDIKNAREDCILLSKRGTITSGEWRPRTGCYWTFGAGTLYPDQVAGWLPRSALPAADALMDDKGEVKP